MEILVLVPTDFELARSLNQLGNLVINSGSIFVYLAKKMKNGAPNENKSKKNEGESNGSPIKKGMLLIYT